MQVSENSEGVKTLRVYHGELTKSGFERQTAIIKAMFPQLPIEFYAIFMTMLMKNGFTDERLADAVQHVVETCRYPVPTAANFLSFDKCIKLYTYNDVVTLVTKNECTFSDFKTIVIKDESFRVKRTDIAKYKIEWMFDGKNK